MINLCIVPEVLFDIVKLENYSYSVKRVLEFLGENVDTKTEIGQEKFNEYCDGISVYGLFLDSFFHFNINIKSGDYICRDKNGSMYVYYPKINRLVCLKHVVK